MNSAAELQSASTTSSKLKFQESIEAPTCPLVFRMTPGEAKRTTTELLEHKRRQEDCSGQSHQMT